MGDTTALVPLDYSRIVYSALLGFSCSASCPGLWSLAGMALIIAASLYLVLTERRKPWPDSHQSPGRSYSVL